MTHPPHKAIVFDCDGILTDTHGVWDRAYDTLFARYSAELSRADRHRLAALPPGPLGRALARLLRYRGSPSALDAEIITLVACNLGDPVTPVRGAAEMVTALAGTRPLAVASNSPSQVVRAHLQQIGMAAMFDAIVGIDDAPAPKPAPDLYRLACARLGVAPRQSTAIEDSQPGIDSAWAAGLYAIGIPPTSDCALDADALYPSLIDPALWHDLAIPVSAPSVRKNLT